MLSSSASSHARDAAAAALALSVSLYALILALRHAESAFPTLALALAATLALQVAGRLLPSPRARAPSSLDLLVRIALQHLPAIATNGARILTQSWARADALIHFGVLFAFLIECVGELLLPQVLDCYYSAHVHRHSGANAAMTSCALAVAGYLTIAGINAFEYGSLLHSASLIALALAMKMLEQRQFTEGVMRVAAASCPFFAELSTAVALVLVVPVSWVARWTLRTEQVLKARADADQDIAALSREWWVVTVVVMAAAQWTATWLYCRQANVSAAGRGWKSSSTIVSTLTGLLCSLVMSAMAAQDGWLFRGVADIVACLLVAYAQHTERQSTYSSSKLSDLDMDVGFGVSPRATADDEGFLDTYRVVSSSSEPTSVAARIVKSLWARDDSRKILMFLSVNVSYMFVELVVGFWTNSLGLIGDAGHMLFDNSALVIGLVASYIGKLPPDEQFTYGYGRVEVLSGFLNSMLLLLISFHLLAEAGSRFFDPPEVSTDHLLLTSVVGLLVNIVGLVWFHDHVHSHGGECSHGHSHGHDHAHGNGHSHGHDHTHSQSHGEEEGSHGHSGGGSSGASNSNMYGVYLHVLADTLGSVGVIVSSLLIEYKDWHIADPLSSAMIALLIFGSTLPLLKETLLQLLQRVPREKERDIAAALREVRATVPGVEQVERWHVWQHAHDVLVGSLQLVVAPSASEQLVMERSREIFRRRAQIDEFLTIQVRKRGDGTHPSSQVESHSVAKVNGAFGFGGGAHAHAHDHHHDHDHSHDHDHQHEHYHDKAAHQEVPSVMSTHENPVSEDVRFGRQGHVVPPAVQYHQHQHHHDASFDPLYEHDASVAPPTAVRLADGFVSQRKPLMGFPGTSSLAHVNNQAPEAFAPRPAYAPSAVRRPFTGDASHKHV